MKRFAIVLGVVVATYLIFFNPIHLQGLPFGKQRDSVTLTDQVNQIQVKTGSIQAEVVSDEGNQVHAKLSGQGSVSVQRSGDTVQVKTHRQFTFFSWWNRSKVTITIPRSYAQTLSLDVGSGTLKFDDEAAYRKLAVNISSGSADLRGISVNSAQVDVHSGHLRMDQLHARSAKLDIRSGNLNVTRFSGAFHAQVRSGNLTMGVAKLSGPVKITVNSGLAKVDLPNDADFSFNGKTNSGIIRCTLPLKEKQSGDKIISGVHGSGTYTFDATVNSGVLRIY
ncbi:DUF4097 domain-containing protein [Sporolactobacillus shoreicorticis]|uniref:DUF4097 family beta strand repeat-containing protein n=1 Tax=Sporolactobacillus shoreicorticis TaxID=1923877 RepID=A0ABW5S636_9BACL|nr:DUF4097 family beta strand repeat-containing protein [Sporolactobacillus shoreicorticis]MCO7127108.1 DUF4097 domain-containing protein [Sporolactobacillus shoreicorticis]